jgi:hypothetical protein
VLSNSIVDSLEERIDFHVFLNSGKIERISIMVCYHRPWSSASTKKNEPIVVAPSFASNGPEIKTGMRDLA